MKLLELKQIIAEAGLAASEFRDNYESGTINPKTGRKYSRNELFLQKVKTKSPFQDVDGNQVIIDPKEAPKVAAWIASGTPVGSLKLNILGGGSITNTKLLKTPEFGGKGTGSVEGKVSNRGNIAEGILGGALFAKLAARIGKTIAAIGPDDVWKSLDMLKKSGAEEFSVAVKDAGRKVVNDKIVFTLKLAEADYNDLMNPSKRELVADLVSSAVAFVNGNDGQKFAEYYYLNGKPDVIRVISDGMSDQKGQKTDVRVIVTDPKTGEKREMELNMSLKTKGIPQFGQVGAGASKKKGDMFRAQKQLWGHFGLEVTSMEEDFENLLDKGKVLPAQQLMYQNAADIFDQLLSGDFDDEEYLYLKQFASAVDFFGTLNDPNIILVDFKGGNYDVLKFSILEEKLKNIDLGARYVESLSDENPGTPRVEIFDKNSGKKLVQIRFYPGKSFKHLIEKGPLLNELISIKGKF